MRFTRPSPRNHVKRVEDLQALERDGLLRFLDSRQARSGGREYTVHIAGEITPRTIHGRKLDDVLTGIQIALTALAAGATNALRRAGHAEQGATATED